MQQNHTYKKIPLLTVPTNNREEQRDQLKIHYDEFNANFVFQASREAGGSGNIVVGWDRIDDFVKTVMKLRDFRWNEYRKHKQKPAIYVSYPICLADSLSQAAEIDNFRGQLFLLNKKYQRAIFLDPLVRRLKDVGSDKVDFDLLDIKESDAVFAFFNGTCTIGMPMEIFFAKRVLNKPVYLFVSQGITKDTPLWLRTYIDGAMFFTVENLTAKFMEFVDDWYKNKQASKCPRANIRVSDGTVEGIDTGQDVSG